MKKKLLLALAIPAAFAACSQEEILTEGQMQQAQMNGTAAGEISFILKEGVDSRLAWDATGDPVWNSEDAFSLFWVGSVGQYKNTVGSVEVYHSPANALYQRESEQSPFESKNIVYVGNHIVVYPADKAHYTDKNIEVKVDAEQDASVNLGQRSVYASNLLTIAEPPTNEEDRDENVMYAGYNEPVVAKVNPLSTNMVLNLNFNLPEGVESVIVEEVELWSNIDVFAYSAYLKKDAYDNIAIEPKTTGQTVTLVYPENTVVTEGTPLTAQFSIMPKALGLGNEYAIKVKTNYGEVVIDKAKLVTDKDGKYQVENVAVAATDDTPLSFHREFNDAAKREETEKSYGFRFTRNVAVDMSTADMGTTLTVTSQEELNEKLAKLVAIGETREITFILDAEEATTEPVPFTLNDFNTVDELEIPYLIFKAGNNTDGTIEFAGTTTIDMPFALASNAIVTGNMTVENIEDVVTLTHSNGAHNLTISNGATLTNNGVIGGHITVVTVAADEEEGLTFGKYIHGASTSKLINGIVNKGEAEWQAGLRPTMGVGSTNNIYAYTNNITEIEAAAAANIRVIRLVDATIENRGDNFTIGTIEEIEIYGNTSFDPSISNNNQERSMMFTSVAKITVKENATLNIPEYEKAFVDFVNNITINVEKSASLILNNISKFNATVNNAGSVNITNCSTITKGTQATNSSWTESN